MGFCRPHGWCHFVVLIQKNAHKPFVIRRNEPLSEIRSFWRVFFQSQTLKNGITIDTNVQWPALTRPHRQPIGGGLLVSQTQ